MKIGFMTFSCPEWTVSQIIEGAKEFNYDGVEIRVEAEHLHGIELNMSKDKRKEVKKVFSESGVEICCLATSIHIVYNSKWRNMDELRRYIQLASDIGTKNVRIFGGSLPESMKIEEAIIYVSENLREIAGFAQENGVYVLVETHDGSNFSLGKNVGEVLRAVNHPYIGALWDVMHPLFHGEKIEETDECIGEYTCHTHVHDSKGMDYKNLGMTFFGEGIIPVKEIMKLLKRRGFRGYLSCEYFGMGSPEEALPRYSEKLRQYLNEI